ncbi:hypothetical protein [uncultured Flavobacterium sp.]|uniref:hypothetical protein n=1 Tax=uncultured Flavobacterium sp. TaxID=165435 RepID=UPI00292E8B7A|nr:hypothetical protein [uncultured Flavobacterium sp.]
MKTVIKNSHYFFLLLGLTLAFTSCDKNDSETNVPTTQFTPTATLVVNNAEESMPVWVNGNKDSKCIILAVHGGPGSDVLDFKTYQEGIAFKKIEEKCLVAYWQQRASG